MKQKESINHPVPHQLLRNHDEIKTHWVWLFDTEDSADENLITPKHLFLISAYHCFRTAWKAKRFRTSSPQPQESVLACCRLHVRGSQIKMLFLFASSWGKVMNKTPNLSTERGINERQIRDMKQSVDSCGQLDFFF